MTASYPIAVSNGATMPPWRPLHLLAAGRRPLTVQETPPLRLPIPGDRIFWIGSATYAPREGTITGVYDDPRGTTFDVQWDEPPDSDRHPWRGGSHQLPAVILHTPGWGWVDERDAAHAPARPPARALFSLGQIVVTPGVLFALRIAQETPWKYLIRHITGDWAVLTREDRVANNRALRDGSRILSAYQLVSGIKIWIITEADRSATTVLLPSEY